jgi:3-dehydroquinate synthase
MNSLSSDISVRFRYTVHFTDNLFAPANTLFDIVADTGGRPRKVFFVVDSGAAATGDLIGKIERYCYARADAVRLVAPPMLVPGGEGVKNTPEYVNAVHEQVHRHGLCRHSFLVCVGGGAVLDMAGYAAATAHRGVRLIRVPTTVLSQNDSGIGVKNSINAFGKKNFLGTFAPPFAVLNDFSFLTTLSDRDWRSGVAEAVKVALIRDAEFFNFIQQSSALLTRRDMETMRQVVYRCAELHLKHIASGGDPFEMGSARPLDFGHWAAHKLEQLTNHRLRHGEAVAIGIALDVVYSSLQGLLSERHAERILDVLSRLGFTLHVPELESEQLLDGLHEFREHLGGELTITLLEAVGRGVEVHEMDPRAITESVYRLSRKTPHSFAEASSISGGICDKHLVHVR